MDNFACIRERMKDVSSIQRAPIDGAVWRPLLHHRSKLGKIGADDLAELLEALEMAGPIPQAVQKRRVSMSEPDENVLRRGLRQAPVIVIRIHRDIDAVRPVLQGREDIAGLGEPWTWACLTNATSSVASLSSRW